MVRMRFQARSLPRLPLLTLAALLAVVACAPAPAAAPPAKPAASAPTGAAVAPASTGAPAPPPAAPAAPAAPPQPSVAVKVATQRLASDAALYVAQERGYFAEQGLAVELEEIVTGQGSIPPLAAGQLDVGVGSVSAGLFNAIARGIDIKLVATKGSVGPDAQSPFPGTQALVLAADLAASGAVQDLRDLRGRSVALPERGAGLEAMLDKALQPLGLSTAELDAKLMPYPDMLAALANRSVDAAMELEPFTTQGAGRGILVRWKSGAELYPGQQAAAVVYGPTMGRLGRDAGNRLMLAYTRGLREYHDAIGPRRVNREEMIATLIRNTALKDRALYDQMAWTYLNPDCYLNVDAMAWDLDWYATQGYVTQKPDLVQSVDHSYCDHALQQLGRYQP
jgi:NitT/TauT family transport system substrate-binding protein